MAVFGDRIYKPMFGESESESPRVPSPWDSLISTPPSPSPSPTPFSLELIPRLVPENDDGNVEYKLQLLSPSPARFARLVTQLKWRLLEGGGQAYYELGVADSGALVGLPRAELEQSLETLEMMAGEIGASVIVVKEIEVPAAMAGLAASQTDKWNGQRKMRLAPPGSELEDGFSTSTSTSASTTETDIHEEDYDDMSSTIVLDKDRSPQRASTPVFSMDPESQSEAEPDQPLIAIDLEIASVFKPRPMRARMQVHAHHGHVVGPTKTKRLKKIKHITHPDAPDDDTLAPSKNHTTTTSHTQAHNPSHHHHTHTNGSTKSSARRQTRDRKREEKRRALIAYATASTDTAPPPVPLSISPSPSPGPVPLSPSSTDDLAHPHLPTTSETSLLVSGLAGLHVSASVPPAPFAHPLAADPLVVDDDDDDGDDDVFASVPSAAESEKGKENGKGEGPTGAGTGHAHSHSRLIVEALVVRKMSVDEAFLDFGGFALM
ncbi:hypothetical protein C0991_002157 [Blastosporella zonata]|nr:hypothetical protein C0991_002157 [Blastosporella zonata]